MRYQRLKERRGSSTRDEDADGEDAAAAAAAAAVEGGDNDNDEDGERARVARLEADVRGVTERLEEQMRKTVDAEAMVDGLGVVLGRLEDEAERESVAAPGAHAPVSASTRGSRRGRAEAGVHEEEEDDEGEEDGEEEEEEERRQDFVPTSQRLADELEEDHTKWDELTLTERYSSFSLFPFPPTKQTTY